jgi:hypothetical protein
MKPVKILSEVLYSMIERGEMQRKFSAKSDAAKERHDIGIWGEKTYKPG